MARLTLNFSHRFVPARDNAGGPTLLLLHAAGGNEHEMPLLGARLHPGAAMLSVRGRVSESGRARYFRRLGQSVFDVEDVRYRARELAAFVRKASSFYGFDPQNVIAVGLGNGATMAAAVLLCEPSLLAGAVLLRPMLPLRADETARLEGLPVLIAAARDDLLIPTEETAALESQLSRSGADVVVFWHQGAHALSEADAAAARSWLSRVSLAGAVR